MKKQLNEIKRMQQLAGLLKENQLNEELTSNQIIRFVSLVDPEGARGIKTYFSNPGSYTIEGAIDYLASHSSLFGGMDNPEDPDGGLSGFTKSDLIDFAERAGWDNESIEYMLEIPPVNHLERG